MMQLIPDIQLIKLQFSTERRIGSMIIRGYSHSPYSHVDAITSNGLYLGARMFGGVQKRQDGYAYFTKTKTVDIEANEQMTSSFYAFIEDQIGKPYDWYSYGSFILNRDWRQDNSWICSELQAAALEYCGFFKYPLSLTVNKIDPGDLLLAISAITKID